MSTFVCTEQQQLEAVLADHLPLGPNHTEELEMIPSKFEGNNICAGYVYAFINNKYTSLLQLMKLKKCH